jgi:hypothetical protein
MQNVEEMKHFHAYVKKCYVDEGKGLLNHQDIN